MNKTPLPVTLQNAASFSETKAMQILLQQGEKVDKAYNALQDAQKQYINSINSAGVQQAISSIQPLLGTLQDKANANDPSGKDTQIKNMQRVINSLNSIANNYVSPLNDLQTDYDDLNKVLSSPSWWGNAANWGFTIDNQDGHVSYGYGNSDKIAEGLKRNLMSMYGQGNITRVKNALSDLKSTITDAQNVANALANASVTTGQNQAYSDSVAEVQKVLDSLQKSLDSTGADAKDNLKEAFGKYEDASQDLILIAQAMNTLYKLHQKTTQTITKEQQDLSNIASSFSSNMVKVNFASSMATDSRLAKLSNPYSQDTEFATYIDAIKNKPLAANTIKTKKSSDDFTSFLSPEVYSYDSLRFRKNNNLWGNIGTIIGNSNSLNSVSGVFSFGYDAWVKNMILGAYGSYAYSTNGIANASSSNKSHNADVGFYSRFFLGQNEIDLNLGESFGFNFLSFKEALLDTTLKSDYISFQTHLDLTYGYVFKIGKGWFSKPFIGVSYNYGYNLGMDAKSNDISMGFDPFQTHFGAVRAGLELRKYFNDNQSYFYIAPAFYQGVLFENTQAIQTRIYESSFTQNTTSLSQNQSLDTSFLIKAGGEWQAGNDIFINISIGAKLGNLSQYGMLNIGGRWVF
ncbi:autotransporter outer membrane beta-barrel domain-containing protein [Helicobacter cappadocius]|uniref:Autotransporter outer membrane beta-barrel domain-containing protein n=1 Tax=Helicobacter cappadocius TaxID=3063998 RepID=A0AA90PLC2_9HELI|nr:MULTISPECIES: autotransporter outer membrane beta-barrel domain-containing protein [unclassified Helicobacter]MDO7253311.1 autotransporter outer membrane beta-barrel domain-containing protein [Helicobacter sp. faydin-H75]MDP2539259.1 autotransporter outer membrane beta-barrel domain-containing protein [Helicobacter sp. faydin-H76]